MKRILHVTTIAYTAEAFLLPLVDRARAGGWTVDLAANGATTSEGLRGRFDTLHELAWTRSPHDVFGILGSAATLRRIVGAGGYDIVHLHTPIAAVAGRAALRRLREHLGVSVVYTAHGFHFYDGQAVLSFAAYSAAERTAGRWTDWLVVMNREDYVTAQRLRIVPPNRLVYIGGIGVDVDHYSPGAVSTQAVADVRRSLGVGEGEQVFVMIAELNKNKRPLATIEAFAHSGVAAGAHLVSLGFGALKERCEGLANTLGVGNRVHFLGYVPDVRPYVLGSVATILFSSREGIPRSSLESLSMGVPVIGSDIRGIRDLVASGPAGWLVPSGDIGALSNAIAEVVGNPAEAALRGVTGRDLVVREYAEEVVLDRYMELYARAVDERPKDGASRGGPDRSGHADG